MSATFLGLEGTENLYEMVGNKKQLKPITDWELGKCWTLYRIRNVENQKGQKHKNKLSTEKATENPAWMVQQGKMGRNL